jgi:UDP-glucose:(heptosyl)LPS alpha-1,3-glucosyltransferase
MRIALVCEQHATHRGGAAQWGRQVARRLAERGHDVRVLTFAPVAAISEEDLAAGGDVAVRRLPWHPSRLARARAMAAAVDQIAADVVHDTGVGWSCDVFHPQTGTRLANYRRDMASRTPRERWLERARPRHWRWLLELRHVERRQFAHRNALFVAVSSMVASSMAELYGVPAERIRHVPNGVDLGVPTSADGAARAALRGRLGVADDETLFLFAAHNPRLKGVRPLLAAASWLRSRQERCKLVLIGHAPDRDLRSRIARLGLDGTVLSCGFVPDASAYYAAADAFVLPSYHDACSLTVFEACAFGAPVITSRYNGASEHVTSGREGFVIDDPADVPALAGCMLELTDAARRRRMSVAARALAQRHDLERNVVELEAVLYEAAEGRRRPAATIRNRTPEESAA